jgi:predicted transcriptional regulator of viral defense system
MPHSTLESARTLAALANDQGGYFTAKQARGAGYDYPHLDYHVAVGNFERVEHGLYRLTSAARAEHDELVRLALWSRNRDDEPQAVVSHDSALFLHELSDLLPSETHLTVPTKFRKTPPAGIVLHKGTLSKSDVEEREGFRVTTPQKSLIDAAAGGTSQEQLEKALDDALARGLVRRKKLELASAKAPRLKRLRAALARLSN